MASIELDGVEYSTRKRTNKLRAELQPLQDEKQKLGVEQVRLNAELVRLSQKGDRGEMTEDDPTLIAGYAEKMADAAKAAEAITPKIAIKVLVDPDGKPPTAKLIDDHADLGDLEHVVAVATGVAAENPTTAPPAES